VVVESVGSEETYSRKQTQRPQLCPNFSQPYKQGRIQATADIYGLTQCYVDFLAQFQVRPLVVPILQGEELWDC